MRTQQKLDSMSPSFCLAKFFDLSLHLQSGHNHSCVHPRTHRIPEAEVLEDAHALHNSSHKRQVRQEMLDGQQPRECGYCWNLERTGTVSDRVLFSADHARDGLPFIDQVREHGSQGRYYPRRVEVSFSTTCNFKCTYCGPEISSRWMKDLDRFGPMQLHRVMFTKEWIQEHQKMPIPDDQTNPYIDAFWRWLPEAYPHMFNLRVTGGEPLLSTHTFRLLEWIRINPNSNLEFGINSNLCVPDKLMDRFIDRLARTAADRPVANFVIWTSGESSGQQANYIRHGLDHGRWLHNIQRILTACPTVQIRIMTTYSVLNMGSYMQFLHDIYGIRRQFPGRVLVDTHTHLQYPKFMAIDILTPDFVHDVEQEVSWVTEQPETLENEALQAERCLRYFRHRLENPWPDLKYYRSDFARYFQQYDQRNGTNFHDTFPRLRDFYDLCARLI